LRLRPRNTTISLYTLYYADEVVNADEVGEPADQKDMPTKPEMDIAKQLIDSISGTASI